MGVVSESGDSTIVKDFPFQRVSADEYESLRARHATAKKSPGYRGIIMEY